MSFVLTHRLITLSAVLIGALPLPAQETKPKTKTPSPKAAAPLSLQVARSLAAKQFAGFTYAGTKPAKNTIDEQGFIQATIVELVQRTGGKLDPQATAKLSHAINLSGYTKKNIQSVFASAVKTEGKKIVGFGELPAWTSGVQKALIDAGLGRAVEPAEGKPGDLVQWWFQFKSGRWGTHVGIVERIVKGRALIYGAHKTTLLAERKATKKKGGIGSGPTLNLTAPDKLVFLVRFAGTGAAPK